jgi:hypothetical protein
MWCVVMQAPREKQVAKTATKEPTKTVRIKHAEEDVPSDMQEFSGFCMKCRVKLANVRGKLTKTANGRWMLKGTHPKCGTTVVKIASAPAATKAKKAS